MANSVTFDPYGFFNQHMALNQTNWADYFAPSIQDGVMAGIGNEMEVYGNSSGMVVKVKSGECRVRSHRGVLSSEATLDIAASDATYDRLDLVVARVTYGNPSTMEIVVKTGVASANPAWPQPTQIAGDVWEMPLAVVYVVHGAVTISADRITDERYIYGSPNAAATSFGWSPIYLNSGNEYRNNTAFNSLELIFPTDDPSGIWCCTVCFTASASFSGVTFTRNGASYSPKLQGVSLNLTSVRYNLTIFWDGAYFWCNSEAA